jgi:putative PEP-CTERM system integral membrane protein
MTDVIDGYVWQVAPSELADGPAASDDFAAFAVRRLILAEIYRRSDALDQLHTLDYLHALAIEHSLVSPYSSMIVLVNSEQQRLLDQLEQRSDRFEREYEEVGETQNPFSVTGVPEPHEWLLLALAAIMLFWWSFTYRRGIRFWM